MTAPMVRILGLLGAALLLASCSGPFFSKVEVKASPTVYAALGNAKGDIADFLTVQKVRDALKGNADVKVYDFQDTSTIQKFLVHYPITSVDLDFASYMKNLNLDSKLSQSLAPGTFTVPSLNQTVKESGSFDLNGTLRSQVNSAFTALSPSTTFVETGSVSTITPPAGTLPDVPITLSTFDSATFSAGSLNLTFAMPAASTGLVLSAQIALMNGSTVLAQTASPVNVKSGTATIPLTGVTLPKTFQIRFNASTSGGNPGDTPTINVTPSLSSDIALSSATGLNLPTTSVTVNPVTVPVNTSGKLVSATVGTGKITINLAPLWSGFTRSTDLTLTQVGNGTLATVVGNTSDTIEIVLDGKTLTNGNISVAATTSVAATNGTLTGLSGGAVSLGVDAVVDISLFSTIKVAPGTDFKLVQTFHEPISQQMKDWVDVIRFTEVGIKFTITNSLPGGTFGGKNNDMTINMKSDAFAIPYGAAVNLPAGQSTGLSTPATFTNTSNLNFIPTVPADLDFEVTITPSSYNAGQIDLVNIVPGTALSVGGTVELVANWTNADVSPPSVTGYSGTFPSVGNTTDLSVIGDYLGTGLTLGSVPTYLSLSGLPGAVMATSIKANYGGVTNESLVNGNLTVASTGPTFDSDGDGIVTVWDGSTAQATFDLANILNAKPANLSLDYSLNLASSVTVANDPAQPSQKIQADLVIVLPVSIIATSASGGAAELKIGNMMPTTDLFGRTVGGDNSNINQLLDKLVSLSASVTITNTTGLSGQADLVKGASTDFKKSFTLPVAGGTVPFVIDKANLAYIKATIPFNPTLTVSIPGLPGGKTYDLTRGGGIKATITVNAVTDIDQTFNLRGTN